MTTPSLVVVIRHGQRIDNVQRPYTGEKHNPGLSPHGHLQAQTVSAVLASLPGAMDKPWVIVSSPFTRCIQTSCGVMATAKQNNLSLRDNGNILYVDFRLSEHFYFSVAPENVGKFTSEHALNCCNEAYPPQQPGKHTSLVRHFNQVQVLNTTLPPLLEGIEDSQTRFIAAIPRIVNDWHAAAFPNTHLLVVTHGCMLGAMMKAVVAAQGVIRPRITKVALAGFVASIRNKNSDPSNHARGGSLDLTLAGDPRTSGVEWTAAAPNEPDGDGSWTYYEGAESYFTKEKPLGYWPLRNATPPPPALCAGSPTIQRDANNKPKEEKDTSFLQITQWTVDPQLSSAPVLKPSVALVVDVPSTTDLGGAGNVNQVVPTFTRASTLLETIEFSFGGNHPHSHAPQQLLLMYDSVSGAMRCIDPTLSQRVNIANDTKLPPNLTHLISFVASTSVGNKEKEPFLVGYDSKSGKLFWFKVSTKTAIIQNTQGMEELAFVPHGVSQWQAGFSSVIQYSFTSGPASSTLFSPCLFAYNGTTGDVQFCRINDQCNAIAPLSSGQNHGRGWTTFFPFPFQHSTKGSTPHYFAYKRENGAVAICEFNNDGPRFHNTLLRANHGADWTHFTPFLTPEGSSGNFLAWYIAYSSEKGTGAVCRLTCAGDTGEDTLQWFDDSRASGGGWGKNQFWHFAAGKPAALPSNKSLGVFYSLERMTTSISSSSIPFLKYSELPLYFNQALQPQHPPLPLQKAPKPVRFVVIGVGGASGSGKSTAADAICCALGSPFLPWNMDKWFMPAKMPSHPAGHLFAGQKNWETPEGVDADGFLKELQQWMKDVSIFCIQQRQLPTAEARAKSSWKDAPTAHNLLAAEDSHRKKMASFFGQKCVLPNPQSPAEITTIHIVIEGFLLYYWPAIAQACNLRFFVVCPQLTCRQRRCERSQKQPAVFNPWFDEVVWKQFVTYFPTQMANFGNGMTIDGTMPMDEVAVTAVRLVMASTKDA